MSAVKERRLVGAHVEIEPGRYAITVYNWEIKDGLTYEEVYARKCEDWAREVMEFFRDHRHQDVNAVSVVREYEDVCSGCGRAWEINPPDSDCPNNTCAHCGEYISGPQPPDDSKEAARV